MWAVVAALVLVAANLRTLMASLPPLAEAVRADLGLSSAWMGVLTTVPVLCMGLLAPVANQVARRVGSARSIASGIAIVLSGLVLRGAGGEAVWALYAGTFLAGTGIALAGTLLPGIVKAVFPPRRAGLGTGLTMFSMMGGAAVASAAAVPLATALGGWSRSLLAWAAVALARDAGVGAGHPGGAPPHAARRGTRGRQPRASLGECDGMAARRLPHLPVVAVLLRPRLARPDVRDARVEREGCRAAHGGLHRLPARVRAARTDSPRPGPGRPGAPRGRRLLGGLGQVGVWLAPDTAPWLWAVLLGAGPGRRLRARPRAARPVCRHTPGQRPPHRDGVPRQLQRRGIRAGGHGGSRGHDGWLRGLWALLALVAVPQLALAVRLRPDLHRVGAGSVAGRSTVRRSRSWPVWAGRCTAALCVHRDPTPVHRLVQDDLSRRAASGSGRGGEPARSSRAVAARAVSQMARARDTSSVQSPESRTKAPSTSRSWHTSLPNTGRAATLDDEPARRRSSPGR